MRKRRPSISDAQIAFTFDPPAPATMPADLAGLDRMVAAAVATALKEDSRPREVIAGAMSALLGEPVTKLMLDAYASEARDQHNIPAHRALALVAVTERFDLLDALARRIGAAILVGEELRAARRGHLQAQLLALKEQIRALDQTPQTIERKRPK